MIQAIGKYKIVRLIGEGTMGEVYEGIDEAIERRVAIKILHPQILSKKNGDEFLQRFKREAKLAAQCMHPNVVAVLEYGQHKGAPFIAMEYVEGTSLDKVLNQRKVMSIKSILLIMSQILSALHAAHSKGIIHRDIKPANIILLDNGEIKLADFGVARMPTDCELTQVGVVIGTPRFMAPEQMMGMDIDQRIDLFAVTIVFMDLLSLLPTDNTIPMGVLPTIPGLPPSNFIKYKQQYPLTFFSLIQQGLAASVDQRISTAQEFSQAIEAAMPDLKSAKALESNKGKKLSVAGVGLQDAEIKNMEHLLSSYIGPIAKKIVETQQGQAAGVKEFALRLADEIPTQEERKEFLQRWDEYLKTTLMSHPQVEAPSAGVADGTVIAQPGKLFKKPLMSAEQLKQLEDDFVVHVGPMASRLMKHGLSNSTSVSELIYSLAEDIPIDNERQEFIRRWVKT